MEILIFAVIIAVLWIVISNHIKKKRLEARRTALLLKYDNDHEIVKMIMSRMFWQGQTPMQLIDSLGHPADIDKKVLKTKSKEIWKYNQTGRGRFSLRITIENDLVVGWDKKS
jgi:cbb3-type cytochrome oxidase subunit 3